MQLRYIPLVLVLMIPAILEHKALESGNGIMTAVQVHLHFQIKCGYLATHSRVIEWK